MVFELHSRSLFTVYTLSLLSSPTFPCWEAFFLRLLFASYVRRLLSLSSLLKSLNFIILILDFPLFLPLRSGSVIGNDFLLVVSLEEMKVSFSPSIWTNLLFPLSAETKVNSPNSNKHNSTYSILKLRERK